MWWEKINKLASLVAGTYDLPLSSNKIDNGRSYIKKIITSMFWNYFCISHANLKENYTNLHSQFC